MHPALVEWGVEQLAMEWGRVVETMRTDNESQTETAAPVDLVVDLTTLPLSQAGTHHARLAHMITVPRATDRHTEQLEQATSRLAGLTSRERQVSELVAAGYTDRQIARALLISPRTVQKHLENIYRKVGLGNRTSLAAMLHRSSHISVMRLELAERSY